MTELAEQPLTTILAQLTFSPFIIMVILALAVLIIFRSEKGCIMFFIGFGLYFILLFIY